jgi:NADPH:quinone reductase-like Zn-dependent oxidoreductase
VPADLIAPVPDGLGLITAAAIGLSGITAVDALDALSITGLETVLIYGPLTAASRFALQLAKRRGAVVAVVTDAPSTALAWSLGADVVMPGGRNTHQMIAAVRNIMGAKFDAAVTTTSDPTVVAEAVRTGGTFTSLSNCGGHTLRSSSGFTPTLIRPTAHKLTNLLFQAAAGQLTAKTPRTVNFDQIPEVLADASSCHHHIVATH